MKGNLTALKVDRVTRPGLLGDGDGLWLKIGKSNTKSWVFRYRSPILKTKRNIDIGAERYMGLGALNSVTLAEARLKAAECRKALADGKDPLEEKRAHLRAQALQAAKTITFAAAAEAFISMRESSWRDPKSAPQWRNTIKAYAIPIIGGIAVQDIDRTLIAKTLEPIWISKNPTAKKLRERIGKIFEWADSKGYRQGENPADLKRLTPLLPQKTFIETKHHPALPHDELYALMTELGKRQNDVSAQALEFCILTAVRSANVRFAQWGEIDFNKKVWNIPASKMKTGKAHSVPLCDRAISVLTYRSNQIKNEMQCRQLNRGNFNDGIFLNPRNGKPLSDNGLRSMLQKSLGYKKVVVHGFRSTFGDWAAELTDFERVVIRAALAHGIKDKVEGAYIRTDLFDKRRKLMDLWAKYCYSPLSKQQVVIEMSIAANGVRT